MNKVRKNYSFQPSELHRQGNLSPIKPRQKMPTIYRHRYSANNELDDAFRWSKDNSYLKKRLNQQVELQRSTMIMKTGRISQDTPNWMTLHYHHYKKDNLMPINSSNIYQQKQFDVLNNKKNSFQGRNQENYYGSMTKESQQSKLWLRSSINDSRKSTLNHLLKNQRQVTEKVGSISERDYTIYRPQLKVGCSTFIDTYSPF